MRQLRRAPGFAAAAVLTLALGIGAATTVFAVVNAVALRPLAVSNVKDVYAVFASARPPAAVARAPVFGALSGPTPYTSVVGLRWIEAHRPASVEAVAGRMTDFSPVVQAPGHAEVLTPLFITSGFAEVFGVGIQAGHWPTPAEDQAARSLRVAVISDHVWSRWFGRSRAIVGHSSLRINSSAFTIIGVAPSGFENAIDLWLPLDNCMFVRPVEDRTSVPCGTVASVYVRARHGAPLAELTTEIGAAEIEADPASARGVTLEPALDTSRAVMPAIVMLLALAALILFAACANLANMLYARGLQRAGEIAVRLSLGASRVQVIRLLVVEAAVLAAAAAALGLALALGALAAFQRAFPSLHFTGMHTLPAELTPDYRVWIAALAAGAFAALAVGFATAWRTSRIDSLRSLASTGAPGPSVGRGGRVRTALVAVQITAAVVLVIFTGLYLENVPDALRDQINFDTRRVVAGRIDLALHGYPQVKGSTTVFGARGDAFFARLLADASRLPGVEAAALAKSMPGGVGDAAPTITTLTAEGAHGAANDALHRITARYSVVSPGFLRAIDVPLRDGRDLSPWDTDGAPPVAVLSESAAAALWPGQPAVGKRVMFGHNLWLTVIGVSADPLTSPGDSDLTRNSNFLFVPLAQVSQYPATFIVLRSASPHAVVDPLRAAVTAIDANVAVLDPATMDESLFAWYGPQRAAGVLLTSLGAIALGIATLGVYGVIAYFVTIRTREFGIRLALGATPRRLTTLVVDHAVHIVLVGLLSGVFVAAVGSRLIEANRAGTAIYPIAGTMARPTIPNGVMTWTVVPLLMLAAGLVAAYVPARRASRIDPNVSLREP